MAKANVLYRRARRAKKKPSIKVMAKQFKTYLKKTKGMSQMGRRQFYRFNYGIEPPPETMWRAAKKYKTIRTQNVEKRLRRAGVSEREIRKLQGER